MPASRKVLRFQVSTKKPRASPKRRGMISFTSGSASGRTSSIAFLQQTREIAAVVGRGELLGTAHDVAGLEPAFLEGDFLEAGDLQAGAMLNGANEFASFDQRV